MRYHGGKFLLADKINAHFPPHKVYVEVCGGAASVLLRKQRVKDEIYNDIDMEIVNVFRVLRNDKKSARLLKLCRLTPYSREEFFLSLQNHCKDDVERARRTLFKSASGFSTNTATRRSTKKKNHVIYTGMKTGFRRGKGNFQTAAMDWAKFPDELVKIIERFKGVLVERKPAIDIIEKYDDDQTLFYVDPPYVHESRKTKDSYRHEMTNDDHIRLAKALHKVKGMVILSGYRSALYDKLYKDWRRVDFRVKAQSRKGTKIAIESIWLSPNVPAQQMSLI